MKSLEVEKEKSIPKHVAIIMDGNGRWAKLRGKDRLYGHRKGVESVRRIIKYSAKIGVKYLTLYTFSTENWNRPKNEVDGLMKLFSKLLEQEIPELYKNNVKILFIGRKNRLSKELLDRMVNAQEVTKNNTGLTLILAFDYGGRQEIVDACREVCRRLKLNQLEKLDNEEFSKYLYLPDVPDPDLVIRTSGEFRISNFLLWQTAYSEFYFTEVLWPDFDEKEFDKALEDYSKRERRFGKI
uniref:Isoprenyl transferase n=1 Tax=candidate division WOR-3 bacterium TaxID=2052148 RepID=A0A7C3J664_UNCW3